MAIESLIPAVATVLSPLLGLGLTVSRRNRLKARVGDYLSLADQVDVHDAGRAQELRQLAGETIDHLIATDRASLIRRFDPVIAIATVLLAAPGVVLFVVALGWTGWAKFAGLLVGSLWTLAWVGGGLAQMSGEHTTESDSSGGPPRPSA